MRSYGQCVINGLQLFLRDYTIDNIKIRVTNPPGMTQEILTLASWKKIKAPERKKFLRVKRENFRKKLVTIIKIHNIILFLITNLN